MPSKCMRASSAVKEEDSKDIQSIHSDGYYFDEIWPFWDTKKLNKATKKHDRSNNQMHLGQQLKTIPMSHLFKLCLVTRLPHHTSCHISCSVAKCTGRKIPKITDLKVQSPIISLLAWDMCVRVCLGEWGVGGEAGMCISMRSVSVDFHWDLQPPHDLCSI